MHPEELRYTGCANHPDLGEAQPAGSLHFTRWDLRFESEAANVELPLEGLKVAIDPQPELVLVRFTHPKLPGWTLLTDGDILEHPAFTGRSNLKHQLVHLHHKHEVGRRVKASLVFLAAFTVIMLVCWLLSDAAVDFIVARVPVSVEEKVGQHVLDEMRDAFTVTEEDPAIPRMKALVDKLAATSSAGKKYSFRLHIVEDGSVNAFAAPGGFVFVTRGLLTRSERPEEVAGVLAHEVAHVTRRHTLRSIVSSAVPSLLVAIATGNDNGMLSSLSVGYNFLLEQRFSRDLERDADEEGWRSLVAADIDPRGMLAFMEKVMSLEAGAILSASSLGPMSSHPPTQERVNRLKKLWDETTRKDGFVPLERFTP